MPKYNPPPNWPAPPPGWTPPEGWKAPANWPPPPNGWRFWLPDETEPRPNWFRRNPRLSVILGSLVGLILITAVTNASDDPTPNAAATPTPSALSTAPTPAPIPTPSPTHTPDAQPGSVLAALYDLKVVSDDAADSADFEYDRDEFGKAWKDIDRNGCDQRNDVLRRDLIKRHTKPGTNGCVLVSGVLKSEYTGKTIKFTRGDGDIAIDHVVSLAEAWRTGASDWKKSKREKFANDPFNLEAVETE